MNATAKKSKYTVGVYCYGQAQWKRESVYDRMTTAPRIVAVAQSDEAAEAWIAEQMARQEHDTPILPGQGWHELYSTISLNVPEAYLSKQNAQTNGINIGLAKKALLSSDVVKI